MICLIVGGFGVGKDTVADLLVKTVSSRHDCIKAKKILSYTTRSPRYEGEKTHLFCTKDQFLTFNDLVAQTEIDGHYYGAREFQFDKSKLNLYCIDGKGVYDIINSNIDDVLIVEVVRPKWLINLPSDRIDRQPNGSYNFEIDYRIMNDGDMEKLKASVLECYNFLLKEMKKSL